MNKPTSQDTTPESSNPEAKTNRAEKSRSSSSKAATASAPSQGSPEEQTNQTKSTDDTSAPSSEPWESATLSGASIASTSRPSASRWRSRYRLAGAAVFLITALSLGWYVMSGSEVLRNLGVPGSATTGSSEKSLSTTPSQGSQTRGSQTQSLSTNPSQRSSTALPADESRNVTTRRTNTRSQTTTPQPRDNAPAQRASSNTPTASQSTQPPAVSLPSPSFSQNANRVGAQQVPALNQGSMDQFSRSIQEMQIETRSVSNTVQGLRQDVHRLLSSFGALSQRVENVESQSRPVAASAALLQLHARVHQGEPFLTELQVLASLVPSPTTEIIRAIEQSVPYARAGLPAHSTIVETFQAQRAELTRLANTATLEDASWWEHLIGMFGSVISIERTDTVHGNSVSAILNRMERHLQVRKYDAISKDASLLPESVGSALAPWLESVRGREVTLRAISTVSDYLISHMTTSLSPSQPQAQ